MFNSLENGANKEADRIHLTANALRFKQRVSPTFQQLDKYKYSLICVAALRHK